MCDPSCPYQRQPSDYTSLSLKVNQLKIFVTDIKIQNVELINILSNISATVAYIYSNLDIKDYEIYTLKKKLLQLESSNFVKDESDEIKDCQEHIEIARWYSSSSSISDSDDSSLKSQSSDNSNSTLKMNVEITQGDKQIITNPNIDEWTVVNKKRKHHVNKKKINKKEVTYPPGLEVVNGWTYLHLYNVQLGTTAKTVLTYIKSLSGYPDCTVDLLKTRAEYASFKIGVPVELAESILMKENWTGNIRIKPWKMNAPPRKLLKDPSSDNSKTDEKNKALITTLNLTLNNAISNTNSTNSKTDAKEKVVTSTHNLAAKKFVKNTSSVNPKTDEKDKSFTVNQKDLKSKTSKPKKNNI